MNREQWLTEAKNLLARKYFNRSGRRLPKVAISLGFVRGPSKAIGQCWDSSCTPNQTYQIFICPTLDDPVQLLGVLLHELIHACVGLKEKHGGRFKKLALQFGLAGKMTATFVEEGSQLERELKGILETLGEFPHDPITKGERKKKFKKPRERRLTFFSPENEGYEVKIKESILKQGVPVDPWGNEMKEKD